MTYIEPTLKTALHCLKKLQPEDQPVWGSMKPLQLIEHLNESLLLATGRLQNVEPGDSEEKMAAAKQFLYSKHPLPKNVPAPFGSDLTPSFEKLDKAIERFELLWQEFEDYYESNPEAMHLHPSFGQLNYNDWLQLQSKHLTHHFEQFNLI
jgi:hypothetical protein